MVHVEIEDDLRKEQTFSHFSRQIAKKVAAAELGRHPMKIMVR